MKYFFSLLFLIGALFAQRFRVTNNTSDDYTSLNNAFSVRFHKDTLHIVYYTDSIPYQGFHYFNVIYAKSVNGGQTFSKVVISDQTDEDEAGTPSIASFQSGQTVHLNIAYYDEDDGDEPDEDIWRRRSQDNGRTWHTRNSVNNSPDIISSDPSNTAGPHLSTDSFCVHYVWIEEPGKSVLQPPQEQEGKVCYMRSRYRIDGTGVERNDPIRNLTVSEEAYLPSVAASQNFVHMVRVDDSTGVSRIYYRRHTNYGADPNWGPVRLISENMPAGSYSGRPCIAANSPYVYVVWEQYIWYTTYYAPNIYFRRSPDNGVTWEPAYSLGVIMLNRIYPIYAYTPSIAVSGPNVYAVWQDRIRLDRYTLLARRSTDNGLNWLQPESIDGYWPAGATDPEMNPSVAAVGNVAHIVWTDLRHGTNNPEIYYYRKDYSSNPGSGGGQNQSVHPNTPEFNIEVKPNPCDRFTRIKFSSNNLQPATIKIYDAFGRLINILGKKKEREEVIWDRKDANGNEVNSGTYFITVESENLKRIAKVIAR